MTKSASGGSDNLVVVDGSNIATEGRSVPSLAQLNEAVLSFREEYPDVNVTVVVDATFGHRIDKREVEEFNEAVAHNELVAPPAGAVGRGDAFVLGIANKSGARILSNDSFQEFHGTYPWLFDEGRLIGGKPVPYVGWVFVSRVPVKGPVSRKARAAAADAKPTRRSASKLASQPMPVPTSPPPGPAAAPVVSAPTKKTRRAKAVEAVEPTPEPKVVSGKDVPVNDLLPFLEFVEHHPVGSSVHGVVESYSSHGAYVQVGDLRGYVPLRLMGKPPPRSAREVFKQGESVTLVVDSFAPARRSVDLALPGMSKAEAEAEPAKRVAAKKTARQTEQPANKEARPAKKSAPAKKVAPAKKTVAAKQTPPVKQAPPPKKAAPAKKAAVAKKPPQEKADARAKKAPAAKKSAPTPRKAAKPAAKRTKKTDKGADG